MSIRDTHRNTGRQTSAVHSFSYLPVCASTILFYVEHFENLSREKTKNFRVSQLCRRSNIRGSTVSSTSPTHVTDIPISQNISDSSTSQISFLVYSIPKVSLAVMTAVSTRRLHRLLQKFNVRIDFPSKNDNILVRFSLSVFTVRRVNHLSQRDGPEQQRVIESGLSLREFFSEQLCV